MKSGFLKGLLSAFVASLLMVSPSVSKASSDLTIVVSIPPLAYFAKKIAGDSAIVKVMIPPGANPHIYEPTPDQLRFLDHADLYVAVGSGIEFEIAWLQKLKELNPNVRFCDSSRGVDLIDSAEPEHGHGSDPHVWLSPRNAMLIVKNITAALSEASVENRPIFETGSKQLIAELERLDQEIESGMSPFSGQSFLVYHPAWAYFAKDYRLREIAIEADGKEPSARHIVELIKKGQSEHSRAILVSPQFSQKSAQMIGDELRVPLIIANDLAENYTENIMSVYSQLKVAFNNDSN